MNNTRVYKQRGTDQSNKTADTETRGFESFRFNAGGRSMWFDVSSSQQHYIRYRIYIYIYVLKLNRSANPLHSSIVRTLRCRQAQQQAEIPNCCCDRDTSGGSGLSLRHVGSRQGPASHPRYQKVIPLQSSLSLIVSSCSCIAQHSAGGTLAACFSRIAVTSRWRESLNSK